MRRRHDAGFTLIELLVVIIIIVVLMTLLSVILVGVVERARTASTITLVRLLDQGCQNYFIHFNQYPNAGFPVNGATGSTKNLHALLGAMLTVTQGFQDATAGGPPPPTVTMQPLVKFEADHLQGPGSISPNPARNIVDAWGMEMYYLQPGTMAGVPAMNFHIWSRGRNNSATAKMEWVGNWEQHTVQ